MPTTAAGADARSFWSSTPTRSRAIPARWKRNGIYIVYTKEAQTADSYIERATYDLGKNHRVRVATSDNMEQVIILGHGALRISARAFEEEVAEAEGQISDLIERWNVRDFDLRRVRATATIIDKKEEKGS